MNVDETHAKEEALLYWQEALEYQMRGEFADAIELYLKSIQLHPTAEAHTYLGWTYSIMGRIHDAIDECKRAIAIDPDFGNPYNDIGASLIQLGEHDAAIPWLEKAIVAPRYEARAHPFMNLGRVFEHRFEWSKAIANYRRALEESPDYKIALVAMKKLQAKLN